MKEYEYVLLNKEMSERLNIGVSTLRKWAAALEKNGYYWEKNDDGTRYYTHYDQDTLILFKSLVQEQKFNLEQAAKVIISKREGNHSSLRAGDAPQEIQQESKSETHSSNRSLIPVTNESIQNLIDYIKEQDKLNRHLLEKIEEMEKERKSDREILERMEHQLTRQENRANERDKMLMENIRSIQQLAITKQKNSFWNRLFNK
ncbi:hypothetical protein COE15_20760 [Bacillus cereus]|nr:hypothetical protein COE15_20760 [Bacillus cereus]